MPYTPRSSSSTRRHNSHHNNTKTVSNGDNDSKPNHIDSSSNSTVNHAYAYYPQQYFQQQQPYHPNHANAAGVATAGLAVATASHPGTPSSADYHHYNAYQNMYYGQYLQANASSGSVPPPTTYNGYSTAIAYSSGAYDQNGYHVIGANSSTVSSASNQIGPTATGTDDDSGTPSAGDGNAGSSIVMNGAVHPHPHVLYDGMSTLDPTAVNAHPYSFLPAQMIQAVPHSALSGVAYMSPTYSLSQSDSSATALAVNGIKPMSRSRAGSQRYNRFEGEVATEKNVYVRGLAPNMTDQDLENLGKEFGKIMSSKAMIDFTTGICKGFGFIMYESEDMAQRCMEALNERGYNVSYAKEGLCSRLKKLQNDESRNVYIANLPLSVTEEKLCEIFAEYNVETTKILRDQDGAPKGVGFVCFETNEDAQAVIDQFNGTFLEPNTPKPLQMRFADNDAQKKLKHNVYRGRKARSSTTSSNGSSSRAAFLPMHGPANTELAYYPIYGYLPQAYAGGPIIPSQVHPHLLTPVALNALPTAPMVPSATSASPHSSPRRRNPTNQRGVASRGANIDRDANQSTSPLSSTAALTQRIQKLSLENVNPTQPVIMGPKSGSSGISGGSSGSLNSSGASGSLGSKAYSYGNSSPNHSIHSASSLGKTLVAANLGQSSSDPSSAASSSSMHLVSSTLQENPASGRGSLASTRST